MQTSDFGPQTSACSCQLSPTQDDIETAVGHRVVRAAASGTDMPGVLVLPLRRSWRGGRGRPFPPPGEVWDV